MSRSLVGRALRAKPSIWEQPAGCIGQQQRSFTQTSVYQDNQVIFDKTSNAKLAPILESIQSSIILPYYLPVHQRQRVFSEKMKHSLRSNPVYVEVDGYEHRFDHIDTHSIPASRAITWEALRAMESPEDWKNFGRLLAGMSVAGRRYTPVDFAKMIRIAGSKGQIYSIIEAARQVRHTYFKLDTREKVGMVMHYVQMRAAASGWDKEMTEQSLRWAEMVLEMVQDEKHQFKHNPAVEPQQEISWPLHRDPQVIGAVLHLSAVLAVKHNDGKDVDGKVALYAQKLTKTWPSEKGLKTLYHDAAYENEVNGVKYLTERTPYLSIASPILHGLLMAGRVVQGGPAKQLKAISKTLGTEVMEAVNDNSVPAQRGMDAYNLLFQSGEAETE
ncbi:hypothetical protein CkaCkLH20_09914 [Colletotrichum karsti]|uniref:Uncharacterized protein n=1 Tax=Colletotrichum karsti TaxID=1095194 RepID=A0A9P6HYY9_9PEZI|nr:uncharacterized protein CkaCkLH20_09914 [Colletotrichum karsti]KAF9872735.1 hypothetical protein CkaCkLH20_09914 [Colletotrichum karsti]